MADHPTPGEARRLFKQTLSRGFSARRINLFCPACHKQVSSDMPWICGHCEFTNRRTGLYSFLHACQKCETEPGAVECPHCGQFIVFASQEGTRNAARRAAEFKPPPRQARPEDPSAQKRREFEEKQEDLRREVELEKLRGDLAHAKRTSEPPTGANLESKRDGEIDKFLEEITGDFRGVKRARAKAAERFKDDPDLLERINEALDHWLEQRS